MTAAGATLPAALATAGFGRDLPDSDGGPHRIEDAPQTDGDAAGLTDTTPIILAHVKPFRLGEVRVRPATRELVGADDRREVLEPRIMQVLAALARAEGEIVSRDDLILSCWDGRVVGEDAIDRVIVRLRRAARAFGDGGFQIETITKVGYRLTPAPDWRADGEATPARGVEAAPTQGVAPADPVVAAAAVAANPIPRRRAVLVGGIAAAVAAVAGGAALVLRSRAGPQAPPADIAPLMDQASLAIQQADSAGDTTAIGLMQRVTAAHPDYAPGWGMLAEIYAHASHWAPSAVAPTMVARAKETAQRALALDPRNTAAPLALALTAPFLGSWRATEDASRAVLARAPDDYFAVRTLALTMGQVGRCRERARLMDHAAQIGAPTPSLLYNHVVALWAAGRLEDADRAMARAMEISPRHYAVWFTRLYLLLYTGRAAQALGMLEDVDGRPNGIPETEFDDLRTVIPAIQSPTAGAVAVAAATALCMRLAHNGAGHAENSLQWTSTMGQLDAAFAIAEAYYLDRGFSVGDVRFSTEQGRYTRKTDRSTYILFLPSTASMRSDPRFEALTEAIGLGAYWRGSGSRPDYRAS